MWTCMFVIPEIYKFCLLHFFLLYCLYYVTRLTFCILLYMHEDAICLMIFDKRGIDKPRNLLIIWSPVIYIQVGEYFIRNTLVIFLNMEQIKIIIRWSAQECRKYQTFHCRQWFMKLFTLSPFVTSANPRASLGLSCQCHHQYTNLRLQKYSILYYNNSIQSIRLKIQIDYLLTEP